jgi:hypothetical protein
MDMNSFFADLQGKINQAIENSPKTSKKTSRP